MDSPPKLSGETLIVHHIPLVHCQVSGGRRQGGCGGPLKRTNPFTPPENLGLSRTTSLPERDILQREALVYSSLIQTPAGSSWMSHNRGRERKSGVGGGGSTASDDSSFTSSNSEDQLAAAHTLPKAKPRNRNPLRRNPFLLNAEDDEEEEEDEEDDDGNNLSGYLEDSSFHLHSVTNSALDDGMASFHLHNLGFAPEPFLLHSSLLDGSSRQSLRGVSSDLSNHLEDLDILGLDSQRRHGSSGSNMSMDCGEQDWGDEEEEDADHHMRCGRSSKTGSYSSGSSAHHCSCCALSHNYDPQHFPETFSEPFSECQQGYGSDSSCNSSDGVLVNFSAIYNKMNNGVPDKPPASTTTTNLNGSTDPSRTSSVSDLHGKNHRRDSTREAFYLDLHTSPTEPPLAQQQHQQQTSCLNGTLPLMREPHLSTSSTRSCAVEHQEVLDLDANCNSYVPAPRSGSAGDLASCLQSQARLVVATQNYYKLVTCDLSSQSSPSPVGSSVNSCSDEHSKGSPTPTQPSVYFLFRQRAEEEGVVEEDEDGKSSKRDDEDEDEERDEEEEEDDDDDDEEVEKKKKNENHPSSSSSSYAGAEAAAVVLEGQVYINVSPPVAGQDLVIGSNRPRSRSYDRNLDKSPTGRLGSLERMLSCPVRLSDGAVGTPPPPPPPRVTSFAEIARSKRRNGGSPSQKAAAAAAAAVAATDPFSFSSTYTPTHSHSSLDFSPILEQRSEGDSSGGLLPIPFTRCYSQGAMERHPEAARDARAKGQGVLSTSSSDCRPSVVRYTKDQRPTTLPIQPFTFPHQFPPKAPQQQQHQHQQPKPLPLVTGHSPGMQVQQPGSGSGGPVMVLGGEDGEDASENVHRYRGSLAPHPSSVRPSPLGSYSPVQQRVQVGGAAAASSSSGTCSTCSPAPPPPSSHSPSCPLALSAGMGAPAPRLASPPPQSLGPKRGAVPPMLPPVQGQQCLHHTGLQDSLSPLGCLDPAGHHITTEGTKAPAVRTHHAHHLSPQALKWREYRRRNPLGVERVCGAPPSAGQGPPEPRRAGATRPVRRNVFDFPSALSGQTLGRINVGQSAKQLQQSYSDFLPDYFSMTEKPPEEFCLSPEPSSSSSSCSSSQSHISVDLSHKRGLVKAVNTAVDLIVAHFGTSRDPDVKAKLGNSWVSPNVGHLILKYLCPALQEVLRDGLKAHVLDLIIGQRRCQPWSLAEASTQLGPSTRVLHSLFSKVSQFSELTSHGMRLNAFIFGLLNLKSLEFWFDHLYTHEDIVAAHYNPWGFLPLAQGACRPLFEELLLLLQPLSLLPFDLDLLFEPRLLQKGRDQLRRKEQLRSAAGHSVDMAARSTFQLMRGEMDSWLGRRDCAAKAVAEGAMSGPLERQTMMAEAGFADLWKERGTTVGQRAKGVGRESRESRSEEGGDCPPEKDRTQDKEEKENSMRQDRQAGWWFQLMQSSQVYIDQSAEGSKFFKKAEKKKRSRRLSEEERRPALPPAREGVVEGAESEPRTVSRERPSWMGSPPESVLSRDKEAAAAREESSTAGQGQGLRWGRLFGSNVGSPVRPVGAPQRPKTQSTRPPSGWLSLDRSVLGLVAQTIGGGSVEKALTHTQNTHTPPAQSAHPTGATQQTACEVRALCHHLATEPGQLSFNKGDMLRVLSRADPDWLLCSLGSVQGLVPIVYVTLGSLDDSLESMRK